MTESIEPRPEISEFVLIMEERLRGNDWKGGWKEENINRLCEKLITEVDELISAIVKEEGYKRISDEAADVANFAMMIVDVARTGVADSTAGGKPYSEYYIERYTKVKDRVKDR